VARVSSGGGDPPCTSSGVVSCGAGICAAPRFRGGLRLAALAGVADGSRFAPVRRLALVRRLVAVRRLVVVRRFAVVRRFGGIRFFRVFRAERDAVPRFLRFAISCLASCPGKHSNKENLHAKRGCEVRGGHQMRVTGTHFAVSAEQPGTTRVLSRLRRPAHTRAKDLLPHLPPITLAMGTR
jgi:hypothetical protein